MTARDWRSLSGVFRWRPAGRVGTASEGVTVRGPAGVEVTIRHDGSVLVRADAAVDLTRPA